MQHKVRIVFWLLMTLQLGAVPATAADLSGKHALRGAGLTRCNTFVEAYTSKGPQAHVYFGWIDGYISGLNELSPGTYDPGSVAKHRAARRNCASHLRERTRRILFAQLRSVILAMDAQRLPAGEEKKVLEMGEDRALVYPDTLRRAQIALQQRGFYEGAAHGNFDPSTHKAIIEFQKANGVPITGLPGPITLWALLIEAE